MDITPIPVGMKIQSPGISPRGWQRWPIADRGETQEKLTDQWGHSRREHRAALNDRVMPAPTRMARVASHPAKGVREIWKTEDRDASQSFRRRRGLGGPAGISLGPRQQNWARGLSCVNSSPYPHRSLKLQIGFFSIFSPCIFEQ